jgi:hypothetical protein
MKRFLFFLAICGALLGAGGLSTVRTVYVLPMSKGFDQYLANRLTNEHLFQVVTDPARADAFFTDRIGEGFEQKLSEILPEPEEEPPVAVKAEVQNGEEKKAAKKAEEKEPPADARGDVAFGSETVNKLAKAGAMSTLSRSRGTLFLVDAKSRQVIWSAYELPRDFSSKQLDRTASSMVNRIKFELAKQ